MIIPLMYVSIVDNMWRINHFYSISHANLFIDDEAATKTNTWISNR